MLKLRVCPSVRMECSCWDPEVIISSEKDEMNWEENFPQVIYSELPSTGNNRILTKPTIRRMTSSGFQPKRPGFATRRVRKYPGTPQCLRDPVERGPSWFAGRLIRAGDTGPTLPSPVRWIGRSMMRPSWTRAALNSVIVEGEKDGS